MARRFRYRTLAAALALIIVLALVLDRYWAQTQGVPWLGQPHLLIQQPHHHIYEQVGGTVEAGEYSCDFSVLPGAWEGGAQLENDAQTRQGDAAHPRMAQHLTAAPNTDRVSRGGASALYGTAEAQAIIWAHQHPRNCRSQRFLIHSPQVDAGIGSQLHVLGVALAVALDSNRVLLLQTNVQRALYTDDAYCGPERPNLDDCYFERLSSCTLADVGAMPANSSSATARLIDLQDGALAGLRVVFNDQLPSTPAGPAAQAAAKAAAVGNLTFAFVPQRLQGLANRSPVAPRKRTYWYKAQASMFIVRPNARTRDQVVQLREQTLHNRLPSYASAISVHVRHGDKWMEAPEQPAQAYLKQTKASGALNREIFLSTDDPAVVAWFAENATGWHVSYTDSVRKPDPRKSTTEYARERGYAAEYLDSLLNLELAVECGAWVGTLTSNWCRLIDELRSTARCKASGVYLDAAQGDAPEDFGWRR